MMTSNIPDKLLPFIAKFVEAEGDRRHDFPYDITPP